MADVSKDTILINEEDKREDTGPESDERLQSARVFFDTSIEQAENRGQELGARARNAAEHHPEIRPEMKDNQEKIANTVAGDKAKKNRILSSVLEKGKKVAGWVAEKGKDTLRTVRDVLKNKEARKQIALSIGDAVGSMVGVKALYDLPRFIKQKITKKREKDELDENMLEIFTSGEDVKEIYEKSRAGQKITEEEMGSLQESAQEENIVRDELDKRLASTKSLAEDERGEFQKQLKDLVREHDTGEAKILDNQMQEVDQNLRLYLRTKISNTQMIREGLNSAMVFSGAFALRGVMYAGTSATEWALKVRSHQKKQELKGEEIETWKEALVKEAVETGRALALQGRTGEEDIKGRGVDFARAAGKIWRAVGITGTAFNQDAANDSINKILDAASGNLNLGQARENFIQNAEDRFLGLAKRIQSFGEVEAADGPDYDAKIEESNNRILDALNPHYRDSEAGKEAIAAALEGDNLINPSEVEQLAQNQTQYMLEVGVPLNQSTRFVDEISNEGLREGTHDSIWRSTKKIFLDNKENFGYDENSGDDDSWAERKTANLIAQLEKNEGGLKDLVHEGDNVVVTIGEDGEPQLAVEESSGRKRSRLADIKKPAADIDEPARTGPEEPTGPTGPNFEDMPTGPSEVDETYKDIMKGEVLESHLANTLEDGTKDFSNEELAEYVRENYGRENMTELMTTNASKAVKHFEDSTDLLGAETPGVFSENHQDIKDIEDLQKELMQAWTRKHGVNPRIFGNLSLDEQQSIVRGLDRASGIDDKGAVKDLLESFNQEYSDGQSDLIPLERDDVQAAFGVESERSLSDNDTENSTLTETDTKTGGAAEDLEKVLPPAPETNESSAPPPATTATTRGLEGTDNILGNNSAAEDLTEEKTLDKSEATRAELDKAYHEKERMMTKPGGPTARDEDLPVPKPEPEAKSPPIEKDLPPAPERPSDAIENIKLFAGDEQTLDRIEALQDKDYDVTVTHGGSLWVSKDGYSVISVESAEDLENISNKELKEISKIIKFSHDKSDGERLISGSVEMGNVAQELALNSSKDRTEDISHLRKLWEAGYDKNKLHHFFKVNENGDIIFGVPGQQVLIEDITDISPKDYAKYNNNHEIVSRFPQVEGPPPAPELSRGDPIEFGGTNKVQFTYDKDNNIKGLHFSDGKFPSLSPEQKTEALSLLDDSVRAEIESDSAGGWETHGALRNSQRVEALKLLYEALVEKDQADSREANYILAGIEKTVNNANKKYRDVFSGDGNSIVEQIRAEVGSASP